MILDDQEYLTLIADLVRKKDKKQLLLEFQGAMNLIKFLLVKLGGEITFNTDVLPHYSELSMDYIHDEIKGIDTLRTLTQ